MAIILTNWALWTTLCRFSDGILTGDRWALSGVTLDTTMQTATSATYTLLPFFAMTERPAFKLTPYTSFAALSLQPYWIATWSCTTVLCHTFFCSILKTKF